MQALRNIFDNIRNYFDNLKKSDYIPEELEKMNKFKNNPGKDECFVCYENKPGNHKYVPCNNNIICMECTQNDQ